MGKILKKSIQFKIFSFWRKKQVLEVLKQERDAVPGSDFYWLSYDHRKVWKYPFSHILATISWKSLDGEFQPLSKPISLSILELSLKGIHRCNCSKNTHNSEQKSDSQNFYRFSINFYDGTPLKILKKSIRFKVPRFWCRKQVLGVKKSERDALLGSDFQWLRYGHRKPRKHHLLRSWTFMSWVRAFAPFRSSYRGQYLGDPYKGYTIVFVGKISKNLHLNLRN